MNGLTWGCWAIADWSLQWIGRGTAWLLLRRPSTEGESALYAAIGGALSCAVLGGVVGFALSDLSREVGAIYGALLGSSLGVCLGILFGSIVETVDSTIKDLLRSFNSKQQSQSFIPCGTVQRVLPSTSSHANTNNVSVK